MITRTSLSAHRHWIAIILFLLVGRIILSSYLPLLELSEARYAEISRKILALNDWITLWFYDDFPFWGKPPLAFWSVASSYALFGINEFAARFSPLVYSAVTALVIGLWTRDRIGIEEGYYASIIYLTSWLVLHTAGAVLTDPALTFTTTLVMVGFWEACQHNNRRWAYLVWIALALGLLAKGPLALVLCGGACGVWILVYNQWHPFFSRIHLFTGLILMLAIALPWYLLAEQKTPGFLDYFIIGEHFERYTQSEWAGDPYGAVKNRPFGTIWLYFIVAALPWSLIIFVRLFSKTIRSRLIESYQSDRLCYGYLLCWTIVPLLFFTPAKNVLVTYALPSIPALSILLAKDLNTLVPKKHFYRIAFISALVFFVVSLGAFHFYFENHRYNQKPMLEKYKELNALDPGDLVYTGKRIFGPQFYTGGKVFFQNSQDQYKYHDGTFYYAVRKRWLEGSKRNFAGRCTIEMERVDFTLFYCPALK